MVHAARGREKAEHRCDPYVTSIDRHPYSVETQGTRGATPECKPSLCDGRRPARTEDDGDIVFVDAGAVANCARSVCGQRIRIAHSRRA